MKASRRIFVLHTWFGLIAGLFVFIFFCTGSIIVFREELNTWQNPHLFRVEPQAKALSYNELYTKAKQQVPELYLYSFRYLPQAADETIEMRVHDPVQKDYPLLYLNPYTGDVLGVERNSLYDVLLHLHYTFYLGRVGELLAAIFALCLLGSVITGVIVYRKFFFKALLFRIPISFKNWRFAMSGLHRLLGSWSLLFNILLSFSGFYMMMYAFNFSEHFKSPSLLVESKPPIVKQNIDSLILKTSNLISDFQLHYVDFPRKENDPIRITGKSKAWLFGDYNNAVAFDYQSGEIKEIFKEENLTSQEKFEYALYTLHYGQYGGMTIKVIYSFFALAGVVITVSGFSLWYRRKSKMFYVR
jgi:uncharacterized iron-regulated membrane protein